MADISKINNGAATYDVKDAVARQSLAALDASAIKLAGEQTVTGSKTISTGNNSVGVSIKNSSDDSTVSTDVQRVYPSIRMVDKNNEVAGLVQLARQSDSRYQLSLRTINNNPSVAQQNKHASIIIDSSWDGTSRVLNCASFTDAKGSALAAVGMPSVSYVSPIFGSPATSGATYTAVVNGWIAVHGTGAPGNWILLNSENKIVRDVIPTGSGTAYVLMPIRKGATVTLGFSEGINITVNLLIKANAEVI